MNNLFVISFLVLLAVNLFLCITILLTRTTERKIISIVANALKEGNGNMNISHTPGNSWITFLNAATLKHIIKITDIIDTLCDHLNIEIKRQEEKHTVEPEKYVVIKKGKKA